MLRHLSGHFAKNVVAYLALFVALGGTSFAAVSLKRNSVKGKHIAANAVTSPKVKNASLLATDFAPGQLPRGESGATGAQGAQGALGERGEQGEQGPAGQNGTPDAFARVGADGTLQPDRAGFPAQNKGIVQANVAQGEGAAATGTTCFDVPFRPATAIVALDNADAGANVDQIISVAVDRGEDLGDCPASHNDARVRIIDTDLTAAGAEQDPGPADARFFVWFER